MKHIYFLSCLIFTCFVHAQIINFPDPNLKAKLLQPNVAIAAPPGSFFSHLDANNDGEIAVNEVQNVYGLFLSNSNISDLTGLSYFTALKQLICDNNQLTTLTLSPSITLNSLDVSHNQLTTLDVTFQLNGDGGILASYNNLTSFTIPPGYHENVDLSHNQLTSLTFNNTYMDYLNLSYNNLSSMQVNGVTGGYFVTNISNNQFTTLDLSHFGIFDIDSSELDIRGNNNLESVVFGSIQPMKVFYSAANSTHLDLGNYHVTADCEGIHPLITISGSPNLTNVSFKNGFNYHEVTCNEGGNIFQISGMDLSIASCPNLSFLCVDEGEQEFFQTRINQLGLQNQVQVNSYCTFTPGGTFYTVNGNTQFDYNSNGCDAGDFAIPNQKFLITNGTESGTIISDISGNYTIDVGAGSHTITPILENEVGFTISPSNLTASFPTSSSPLTQNFCIASGSPIHNFDITLIPINPAVPGMNANYKLVFKNTGNQIDDGTVLLNFPNDILDFISASLTPTANAGSILSWAFSNFMPFETKTINLTFNLNSPMEIPPLDSGAVLNFMASIGETGAAQPYVNSHVLNQTVVNSFDPNDKICLEGEVLDNNFIEDYVSYKIRFENTGTYMAQNIVVKDMIDTSKFDITSLKPIDGSHNFYTKISGNKVEFIFENINLAFDNDNNDGYVVFKIKLLPEVTEGVPFNNQASIYFDYNFPIVTNTATTVIGSLGLPSLDFTDRFVIFPIPAKEHLQIISKDNIEIEAVEIYNNLGQIMQSEIGNKKEIDVSQLSKGSYYLKIKTDSRTSVKPFLKE